jgi:hypothetical protein
MVPWRSEALSYRCLGLADEMIYRLIQRSRALARRLDGWPRVRACFPCFETPPSFCIGPRFAPTRWHARARAGKHVRQIGKARRGGSQPRRAYLGALSPAEEAQLLKISKAASSFRALCSKASRLAP